MKNQEHLPIFGVGPLYVITIFIITAIGLTLNYLDLISFARFEVLMIPFIIIGIILIILGVLIWFNAVFKAKIDKGILENKLVKTGVYSLSRNPIYSAFMLVNTGIILFTYNLLLLVLPLIYYIFLTILIINTEEKWCKKTFNDEYLEYMQEVNRIIPIKRHKKSSRI